MGFYGSNDPTNSVKALKEVVVLRIGFNPTRSNSPCYNNYTFMQYTVIQKIHTFTYIHKNESKHSEMGPVRQNPIQRLVRSVHMCVHCTVHNCCTQYCTEQTSPLPSMHWPTLLPSTNLSHSKLPTDICTFLIQQPTPRKWTSNSLHTGSPVSMMDIKPRVKRAN